MRISDWCSDVCSSDRITIGVRQPLPAKETLMPAYRSRTSTAGRNLAGARALWRATGMNDGDFDKPIIAVANSFTPFLPGHVHLKALCQLVNEEIEKAGGVGKETGSASCREKGGKT